MAFHGRGAGPSIGAKSVPSGDGSPKNIGGRRVFYHHYPYLVTYDKTLLGMEIVATVVLLAICIATYIFAYQSAFPDPIQSVKDGYILAQFLCLGTIVLLLVLSSFICKEKEKLETIIAILLILSVISLLVLVGIRIHFDGKYTQEVFTKYYETTDFEGKNEGYTGQGISLSNMNIATQKELFVEDCMRTYQFFQIKTIILMVIHILLSGFICFFLIRIRKNNLKKDQLEKDDAILYDDEENVKI